MTPDKWRDFSDSYYDHFSPLIDEFAGGLEIAMNETGGWGLFFYPEQCHNIPEGKRIALLFQIEDDIDEPGDNSDVFFYSRWIKDYLNRRIREWIKKAEDDPTDFEALKLVEIYMGIAHDLYAQPRTPSTNSNGREEQP